ncbi:MAG: CoA transferase [Chloroflexi bacterium]|nr:CoA transferase [Chloroflexota bacterium]
MNQSDRYWPDFCKAISRPDFLDDEKFNNMDARADNNVELIQLLDEVFLARPREEWERLMTRREVSSGSACRTFGTCPTTHR